MTLKLIISLLMTNAKIQLYFVPSVLPLEKIQINLVFCLLIRTFAAELCPRNKKIKE